MRCQNCKVELGRPSKKDRTKIDGRSSTVQLTTKNDKYVKICPKCGCINVKYIVRDSRGIFKSSRYSKLSKDNKQWKK